jgi:hypothetical protein
MDHNAKRNRDICKLLDTKKVSYSIIAKMMDVSRSAVAGIAFRRRHPVATLKHSPQRRGTGNKTGLGYQRASYYPAKTLHVSL